MKWLAQLVAAAAVLTIPLRLGTESDRGTSSRRDRPLVQPVPTVQGDMKTLQEKSSPRTTSRAGLSARECWGVMPRRSSRRRLCQIHPDMKFDVTGGLRS